MKKRKVIQRSQFEISKDELIEKLMREMERHDEEEIYFD